MHIQIDFGGVAMKKGKHDDASPDERRLQDEALRLAGKVTANQRHFLQVGVSQGKALEPGGWLAGMPS